ncbi:MAG: hypothetical protein VX062_04540 [Bacteroidota bacterium]|nr:hypothetical protein [Bacteroidota bacterium]
MRKFIWYFILFTGLILITSFISEDDFGISDEVGYLVVIDICLLTAFFLEYFIPKVKE